jgi:NAD(P)-dependent dehydrogenase (short-subunit alcohol dehydrogenase family)
MAIRKWTSADLPELHGRTFVVTGATSGIGRAAARDLAAAGARVVLAVRDTERGEAAAAEMPGATEVRHLDLTDLASVRAFAEGWEGELGVLINNAGVMAVPEGRTADGFELQIGTNHLGHFALTGLLIGQISDRVVTVASTAHRGGKIRFDDLNWEHGGYRAWDAYRQSKLANLLFTLELQRRLTEAGSHLRAVAAHPGWSATNLQNRTGSRIQNGLMAIGNRLIAQSDEHGAWPTLYAATEDVPAAAYVGPGGRGEVRGHPKLVGRTDAALDERAAKRLWLESERLTGVEFRIPVAT